MGNIERHFWREAAARRQAQTGGALPIAQGVHQLIADMGHSFCVAPTRAGKTRWNEWLLLNVSALPFPVTSIYFDPHGHSSLELLSHFGRMGRLNDVVWIDPAESHKFLSYNPVSLDSTQEAGTRAAAKTSALLMAQGLSETESIDVMPTIRQVYSMMFHGLIESGLTLQEAMYLTASHDEPLRKAIADRIETAYIKSFWQGMDERKPAERDRLLRIVQARLHTFWATPQLQNITSQSARTLDMAQLINSGKTIIIKSQPYRSLTPEDTRLLMALLLEDIIATVFSRPPGTGTPVLLVIDELGDRICGPDVAKAFRGSLKYRMQAAVCTQSLTSLYDKQPEVAREVMTNCSTKIVFRDCPVEDLELLAKEFALESINFDAVKDEIKQTKFWPHETTRTITSHSEGHGSSWGSTSSDSEASGETFVPIEYGFVNEELVGMNNSLMQMRGTSEGQSSFFGSSTAEVPFYEMIPFKEISSRTFRDWQEQIAMVMQQLKAMEARYMAIKQRGRPMRLAKAPFWPDVRIGSAELDSYILQLLESSPYYGSLEEIMTEQEARLASLKAVKAHAISKSTNQEQDEAVEW